MNVYQRAAEKIANGEESFSCIAIDKAMGPNVAQSRARARYFNAALESFDQATRYRIMDPMSREIRLRRHTGFWNAHRSLGREIQKGREIRILALLFASEFRRTGDL